MHRLRMAPDTTHRAIIELQDYNGIALTTWRCPGCLQQLARQDATDHGATCAPLRASVQPLTTATLMMIEDAVIDALNG